MAISKAEKAKRQAEAREKAKVASTETNAARKAETATETNAAPKEQAKAAPAKKVAKSKKFDPHTQKPVIREGRDYAKNNLKLSPQEASAPLPEPNFNRPAIDFSEEEEIVKEEAGNDTKPSPTKEITSKPSTQLAKTAAKPSKEKTVSIDDITDTSELSNREKRKQATALAEIVLEGYQFLCNAGYMIWNYDEEKCNKLVAKGKIDPAIFAMEVPVTESGRCMPLGLFLSEYNMKLKEILTVEDEFYDNALPLLTEIFMKQGVGLSPEWQFAMMFGMNISQKIIGIAQISSSIKLIMKSMTTEVRLERNAGKPVKEAEVPVINQPEARTNENLNPETEIQTAVTVSNDHLDSEQVAQMHNFKMGEIEEIHQSADTETQKEAASELMRPEFDPTSKTGNRNPR